jgi:hypothetical protein
MPFLNRLTPPLDSSSSTASQDHKAAAHVNANHGHSHSTPSVALPHDGEVAKSLGLKAHASAPGVVIGDMAAAGGRVGHFAGTGMASAAGGGGRGSGPVTVPHSHRRTSSSSDAGRCTWPLTPGSSGE